MSPSMNSFCASCAADRLANPATAKATVATDATVTTDNVLAPNFRASIIERSLNLLFCGVIAAARSSGCRRCGALDVGQQRWLRAEHLGHGAPGADLVAPCRRIGRRAADPDGADHLVAVDDDRQAARIGEISERILPQFRRAARQHLVHRRLPGLARIDDG